jgi:hypothetical protein
VGKRKSKRPKAAMQKSSPHARSTDCWAKARQGGICEACGWKPKRNDEDSYKHRGKCRDCGGQMRCRNSKMPNGKCRMHGGTSPPPGPTHPSAKTLEHSKFPTIKNLSERIKEASANPHLMELPRHVSTLEARISELTESLEVGGTGDQWAQARELFAKLDQATRGGEHDDLLDGLRLVLFDGESRAKMWQELKDTIASQVRIIESHRKSQVEAGQTILIAQHVMSMDRLVSAALDGMEPGEIAMARRLQSAFAQVMGVYDQPASNGAIEAEAVQA